MATSPEQSWLDLMATRGDQLVGDLFGYDRLPGDWALDFPRGLPEHLVYLVVAGAAAGVVSEQAVDLSAGSLFWVPPRIRFRLHATGDSGLTLYRIRLATPPLMGPDGHVLLAGMWDLRASFDALVIELSGALTFRAERLRALLVVLFSGIFRAAARRSRQPPLDADQRVLLERYVDERSAGRPDAAELAAAVGLSEDYFVRRFRQTFGVAPRSWVVRRRIQVAMLMLDESSRPVGMVARDLGYPDVFLFSRQFKAVTGMSPRAWRERGSRLR
jgi:AraC-like DNA-binding protein